MDSRYRIIRGVLRVCFIWAVVLGGFFGGMVVVVCAIVVLRTRPKFGFLRNLGPDELKLITVAFGGVPGCLIASWLLDKLGFAIKGGARRGFEVRQDNSTAEQRIEKKE
jgi:hypothetical protein